MLLEPHETCLPDSRLAQSAEREHSESVVVFGVGERAGETLLMNCQGPGRGHET